MTIRRMGALAALALLMPWACTDDIPTSGDPDRIPTEAETYEVLLPWSLFAEDLRSFDGFGSLTGLGNPIVAHEWFGEEAAPEGETTLEARTLIRFGPRPDSIFVRPPGEEDAVPDKEYHILGGRLVLRFDTTDVAEEDVIGIAAEATEARWDRTTVGWEMAVDSVGDRTPWPEPGGGPLRPLGDAVWTVADGDSVAFDVDSLTANEWTDPGADHRGLLVRSTTTNTRFRVRDIDFRIEVQPSVHPDTTIMLGPLSRQSTFIHTPGAEAVPGTFLVGGAPARRATFRINLPPVLDGDEQVCQAIPCPMTLRPEEILFASLVLSTAATSPAVIRPRIPFELSARVVLAPDRLPRSPLGRSVQPASRQIPSELFREGEEGTVILPITSYLQEMVDAMVTGEEGPPRTIALLTPIEPFSLGVASFQGPGSPGEPVLRIIFTLSDGVTLP